MGKRVNRNDMKIKSLAAITGMCYQSATRASG